MEIATITTHHDFAVPTKKSLRVTNVPNSLLFLLKRLKNDRHSDIILQTLREYAFHMRRTADVEQRRCGRTPKEILDKYFFNFYPYPIPKKGRPRSFCLYISSTILEEIKRLAITRYALKPNEFIIQILTERVIDEL